jgi:hypothetical protein
MGLFFGTDGIRGEFQKDMTAELCYRCANALSKQKQGAKILIAKDTRATGDFLMMSFVLGAIAGGMKVSGAINDFKAASSSDGVGIMDKLRDVFGRQKNLTGGFGSVDGTNDKIA